MNVGLGISIPTTSYNKTAYFWHGHLARAEGAAIYCITLDSSAGVLHSLHIACWADVVTTKVKPV